jgi:predicted GNAT family acetyltransferase
LLVTAFIFPASSSKKDFRFPAGEKDAGVDRSANFAFASERERLRDVTWHASSHHWRTRGFAQSSLSCSLQGAIARDNLLSFIPFCSFNVTYTVHHIEHETRADFDKFALDP